MNPNHPFYIDRHPSEILLNGEWKFTYIDTITNEPWTLNYLVQTTTTFSYLLKLQGKYPSKYELKIIL